MEIYELIAPMVWPLAFILVSLLVIRQVRNDVSPIFKGVVGGLAVHSQKYALFYAMGMMLGLLGSLQAMAEVATQLHWVYLAAAAKILQPGLAAIVGYMTKAPGAQVPPPQTSNPQPPTSNAPTNPPNP